jgi:hypothetical protein
MKKIMLSVTLIVIYFFCNCTYTYCDCNLEIQVWYRNDTGDTIDVAVYYYFSEYYPSIELYSDHYLDTVEATIDPSEYQQLNLSYNWEGMGNCELPVSCDDRETISRLYQRIIVNDTIVYEYNMKYPEFMSKTNYEYELSIWEEACGMGFSNYANIIICSDCEVVIRDTFVIEAN